MIKVEYIENGNRVTILCIPTIPAEVWEALKELAEHAEIYELVQQRKNQNAFHSLDDLLA
jgi:hypothetical protein